MSVVRWVLSFFLFARAKTFCEENMDPPPPPFLPLLFLPHTLSYITAQRPRPDLHFSSFLSLSLPFSLFPLLFSPLHSLAFQPPFVGGIQTWKAAERECQGLFKWPMSYSPSSLGCVSHVAAFLSKWISCDTKQTVFCAKTAQTGQTPALIISRQKNDIDCKQLR